MNAEGRRKRDLIIISLEAVRSGAQTSEVVAEQLKALLLSSTSLNIDRKTDANLTLWIGRILREFVQADGQMTAVAEKLIEIERTASNDDPSFYDLIDSGES